MLKIIKILILFVWSYANAQAYTVSQIPFSGKPMTGTLVYATDDAVYGPFNITFNFCFWGNQYSQFYIGSNGWVGFSGGQSPSFTSFTIPNTAANVPKNCIMGPWYDIHPGIAGGNPATPIQYIYYQSYGVSPNRYMVISWNNAPLFQCIALRATQQIVLYEDGTIENSIIEKRICASWANGTATQGLHNITGTQAIVVAGRNSTQWTVTNLPQFWESWKYTPNYPIFVPCCTTATLNSN
jgi:hypothetical protein